MSILSVVQYGYHLLFPILVFVMVHMELRSKVVMYFGSYDIGYAIPSLYHACMYFNEGFTHRERERERHLHHCQQPSSCSASPEHG